MTDIYINEWMKKPNWKQIYLSIECPMCKVPSGRECVNLNRAGVMYLRETVRIEPHMERVWIAISEWQLKEQRDKEILREQLDVKKD